MARPMRGSAPSGAGDPFSLLALALLSAAMMGLEIGLTRVFAVAQFYHFAFLVISLALLGLGASGTWLSSSSWWRRVPLPAWIGGCSLGFAGTTTAAFVVWNQVPFDPFTVAWDRRQWAILGLHTLLFTAPFLCAGLAVAASLEHAAARSALVYAVNLTGTAVGALEALVLPAYVGAEGVVAGCVVLAGLAALVAGVRSNPRWRLTAPGALVVIGGLWLAVARPAMWRLHLSPYKALMQVLRFPGSRIVWQKWNAFSRIDLVESPSIRQLPGLSVYYAGPIPPQYGLFWDGDNPSPVLVSPEGFAAAEYLPLSAAFLFHAAPEVAVVPARGGLDVAAALQLGARRVWAVESNPLVVAAASTVYHLPRVVPVVEGERAFLQREGLMFDIVVFSLTQSYRPVRSGAYSLVEDYRYTVESVANALRRLRPNGLLIITRWLQTPPSEWLRAFALAVEAVSATGGNPANQIVAFRGYNTGTLLVKRTPFTSAEVAQLRQFLADRGWDLVWAPGMRPEWANRHNVLPEPVYYQLFQDLLRSADRNAWYARYPFDVRPPTDDHPFFDHYFRWRQLPEVWGTLGKTWEPFGGAGYLVVLALLGVLTLLTCVLIGLPVLLPGQRASPTAWPRRYPLLYFAGLGLGFLCIELPFIQMAILYLNHATYAFAVVVLTLLFFGALGSWFGGRRAPGLAPLVVAGIALAAAMVLPVLWREVLSWPLPARGMAVAVSLAPLAFVMGMPFPRGLYLLSSRPQPWITWAWAVNGGVSVVASPLATLIAFTWGFRAVLAVGVAAYLLSGITAWVWAAHGGGRLPRPAL